MTKEGIEYNLTRIEAFLGFDGRLVRHIENKNGIDVLLESFSRLMDYNGAGKEQYSLLLLNKIDYDELKTYAALFENLRVKEDFHSDNAPAGPPVFIKGYFHFEHLGYTWTIKQISYYPIQKQIKELE